MSALLHQMMLMGGSRLSPVAVSIYSKLVAWFPLNDTSSPCVDSHILGLAASIGGAIGSYTLGAATVRSGGSSSVLFNGNSSATLGTSLDPYISGDADHAVFIWYRPLSTTSTAVARYLVSSYDTTSGGSASKNDQFGLYIDASGAPVSVWRYGSGSVPQSVTSVRKVSAGVATFIGYNKRTVGKTVEHWKDGASEALINYAQEPTGTSLPPRISGLKGQSTFQAGGNVQELTLFNANLDATEVAWLYNGGAGRSYNDLKIASGH